jgi:hypothetical protein
MPEKDFEIMGTDAQSCMQKMHGSNLRGFPEAHFIDQKRARDQA